MRPAKVRFVRIVLVVAISVVLLLAFLALVQRGRTVPAGALSGRVVDEGKSPVRGARVYYDSPGYSSHVEVQTNWFGNFTLTGLPDDREFTVGVSYLEYGHLQFRGLRTRAWRELQILPHGYELRDKPAPALCVEKWYNADSLSLADLRGKVVLLHIGLHIDNYDDYNRTVLSVYRKYREQEFMVIGIHAHLSGSWPRPVTDGEVRAYLTNRAIPFPVGLDRLGSVGATYQTYQANASPAKYLVDKKGILRCSPLDKNLDEWVARLLAE